MKLSTLKKHLWLTALFVLALPLFCWLQWQPKVWLDEQLAVNGLSEKLRYAKVEKAFPGLNLSDASITLPDGKSVACDEILLRPALSALFSGAPALFVRARSERMNGESIIAMQDAKLKLSDVVLNIDAASLSQFDSRLLLLGLKGEMAIKGHALLQAADGLPLDGDVNLLWNKPSSTLLPVGTDSIELTLTAAEAQGAKVWEWQIASVPEGMGGQGKIMAGGADIRQWLLRGSMRLSKDKPELILSGTLGAPHWQ